ncbi:TetR/AcrR family transcriptional regulator [Aquabacter sp. CN5-332]|uniref:TetR/AcrR family transcriptional regulator n=1 Tax=Aquabacter sp. CN5-332 TaxID=3156608 RepID=UPI0032B4D99D
MMSSDRPGKPDAAPRRRMQRDERHHQLLQVSWGLIREEGTDALSLGRLAERAGVTKPVVYDHFGTRNGLLAALYQEFDVRQTKVMDAALAASDPTLPGKAGAIASSYVECVLTQGREIPGVIAALVGSPELGEIKRDYQSVFIEKCRRLLTPFIGHGTIGQASLWAMLGAADALSNAAAAGEITPEQAKDELYQTIVGMVERAGRV